MSFAMAVFRRGILLSTVVLLTAFSKVSIGQDIITATVPDKDCDCKIDEQPYCTVKIPCAYITCQHIDSSLKVQCAQQFLNQTVTLVPKAYLSIYIDHSNLNLFPDDFLASYNVRQLAFATCNLTEVPMRLINPVCDTLTTLIVKNNNLRHIPEGLFSNCIALVEFQLQKNAIEVLTPMAFYGLNNLRRLGLQENRLTSFNGLQGITELTTIFLYQNFINYLDKNAFQNLSRLIHIRLDDNNISTLEDGTFDPLKVPTVYIDLSGNHLNCNCSLKWLQDWYFDHECCLEAFCGPEQIPIQDVDMSNCTSASSSSASSSTPERSSTPASHPTPAPTDDDSPGRATRSSMTDIVVFIYLIMFAHTYFRVI